MCFGWVCWRRIYFNVKVRLYLFNVQLRLSATAIGPFLTQYQTLSYTSLEVNTVVTELQVTQNFPCAVSWLMADFHLVQSVSWATFSFCLNRCRMEPSRNLFTLNSTAVVRATFGTKWKSTLKLDFRLVKNIWCATALRLKLNRFLHGFPWKAP